MPIDGLIRKEVFGPLEIKLITCAYVSALRVMQLKDQNDPLKEMLARKIIEIFRHGERDLDRICTRALAELGKPV